MDIEIPYKFKPRDYQIPFLEAMDSGIKRAVLVFHRRAGKDKTCFNLMIKKALEKVGNYYYFFPTYSQAKKALWDAIDKDGLKVLDHIPRQVLKKKNESDMRLEFVNGSSIQLIGTENIDSIVGTNPAGCIYSEYSLQNPMAWALIRPILKENGGWAVFNFTPRGKNHAFKLFNMAKSNKNWFAQLLTVRDTGILTEADIEEERKEGMDEELIQQEYYCDFNIGIQGAYYLKQIQKAEEEKRIGFVPYNEDNEVHTVWDLGIGDAMSIWFYQVAGREIHLIDFYEAQGEGFAYYARILQEKGYLYGNHFAPHDIMQRELGTGKSRQEVARNLGINFQVVPKLSVEDGIDAVRRIFNRCWFDEEKCEAGLNALKNYKKEYDEKRKMFKSRPYHDWASHAADAFRYFAVGFRDIVIRSSKKEYKTDYPIDPVTGY